MGSQLSKYDKECLDRQYRRRFGNDVETIGRIFDELHQQNDMIGFLWVYQAMSIVMVNAAKLGGVDLSKIRNQFKREAAKAETPISERF